MIDCIQFDLLIYDQVPKTSSLIVVHMRSLLTCNYLKSECKCLIFSMLINRAILRMRMDSDQVIRTLTFFLLIPSHLVSTFSGKHGRVYYMVQAVLKRPFHESLRVCRELCVISHTDVSVPTLMVSMSNTPSVFPHILISTCFTSGSYLLEPCI